MALKTKAKMKKKQIQLPDKCSPDISRSSGIKITCLGSAMAATIRENSTARPKKRFFAKE